jgi:dihydroxyacetone kinase
MKKLINRPEAVVPELLEGLVRLNPGLALLADETVVIRRGGLARGVALISGGGAGHEPAHAGFVGPGLLHAAVSGEVFTSPSTDAVLAAIRAVTGPAGALLIVKNYTGDRLNFGLAAELARAEGIQAEVVIVDDDVALAGGPDTAGRRGIAGTMLVHKVAGAAAEAGLALAEVKREAESAIAALGSMGVALSACTVPAAGRPGFTLAENEIELGLGIHGEPGVRRTAIAPADAIVDTILQQIITQKMLGRGSRVALLVNNLGGTPTMELMIVARRALATLEAAGIVVERTWAGTFLTAIEMAGCSLSLLALDDARLTWLDAEASSPAWIAGQPPQDVYRHPAPEKPDATAGTSSAPFEAVLRAICQTLQQSEPQLTALDQAVGDGDLGISLVRGASAILSGLPGYDLANPAAALAALSGTLRHALGGTSGPLYAIFLLRAAREMEGADGSDLAAWAQAFAAGVAAIGELGDAKRGDRTMLDALIPASEALLSAAQCQRSLEVALTAMVSAARVGADATAEMTPRRGRSSYLAGRTQGHADPGAVAATVWLDACATALTTLHPH